MSDIVWVAIIMSTGPFVTAYLVGRQRAKERKIDHDRQDKVADLAAKAALRVEETANLLKISTHKVAETAETAAAVASETLRETRHVRMLVNSNLTDAKQLELGATQREFAMWRRMAALTGVPLTTEEGAAMLNAEQRIAALTMELNDRAKTQEQINQQGA